MSASSLVPVGVAGESICLWGRLSVPAAVTEFAAVRISDPEAREDLRRLKEALRRQADGTRIGDALNLLGPDITEDSPTGDRDRLIAGLVPVSLQDLDGRASARLLAYVGVVAGVLVALIPSSAIESDLPPHVGDRTKAPRNGATELVLEAIVTLPGLRMLAVPRLNRLLRRVDYQGRILNELRENDVLLWTDAGIRDLVNQTEMTMANLEGTTKGDGDAIEFKQKVLGGRISALDPGDTGHSQRDFNYNACPLGYRPEWVETASGARLPRKGSIELEPAHSEMIKLSWTMFGAGATLREIGDALAPLAFPLRDGSRRTFRDTSSKRRAEVVRNALTEDLAELHRTGAWVKQRSTSAPIRHAGGKQLARREDGRRATVINGRLPVQLVDGLPWGVSAEVWAAVAERFERQKKEGPRERGGRWSTQLMHFSPLVWTIDCWSRFMKEHTTLQLRTLSGTEGEEPEWDWNETALVASCNFVLAWNRIGRELMTQLALAGAGEVELTLVPGSESDAVRGSRHALATCRARLAEGRAAADTAGHLAETAQSAGNFAAAAEQLENQNRYLLAVQEERVREPLVVADLERALCAERDERAEMRTAFGAAAALMRWDGSTNTVLRAAVRSLGLVDNLRGTFNAATDEIRLETRALVRLADGAETWLPVRLSVPNTSNVRELGAESPALVAAWAKGTNLDVLAKRRSRTTGWVRRAMTTWFAERGINTMVTALLDCPVLTTRQVVAATVAPDVVRMPVKMSNRERLTESTVAVLVAPYLGDRGGSWKSWAGYHHAPDRRLVSVLRIAGGEADVAPLSAAAGADAARLAHPFGQRPALTAAPEVGRRRLKACPHADCRSAWVTHVLYVPETAAYGAICATCRRFPDVKYADASLPPEYLTKWDASSVGGVRCTTRSSAAELRLPDFAAARIAGQAVRSGAGARILGVTIGTFNDLRVAGKLPQPAWSGKVDLWRASDLEELARLRARGHRSGIKDGWLSPADAARTLRVPEHRVRQYCREGLLAYRYIGEGTNARIRIKPEVVTGFAPPAGDVTSALSVEAVHRQTGITRWVIETAVRSGDLCSVLNSSGRPFVLPAALTAWLAERPALTHRSVNVPRSGAGTARAEDGRLSVSAAASILGMSGKQVRLLAAKGVLDDHREAERAWRWFDRADVVRLAVSRAAGAGHAACSERLS